MSSYQSSFAACLPIMITPLIKKLYEQLLLLLIVVLIFGGLRIARASVHACNFKLHAFLRSR